MSKRRPKLSRFSLNVVRPLPIGDREWQLWNSALGIDIEWHIFDDVAILTELYVEDSKEELSALIASEVIAEAQKLCAAATEFRQLMTHPGRAPLDTASYVRHVINLHLRDFGRTNEFWNASEIYPLEPISEMLELLEKACNRALTEISYEGNFQYEGDGWDLWIFEITQLFESAGLPIGVRKDESWMSPFVMFVRELQLCLPDDLRRHTHSDSALAAAIVRARQRAVREAWTSRLDVLLGRVEEC